MCGMAEETPRGGAEELWLPDEFLDDVFFTMEEKAAVAAKSESDEEDGLGGLTRRLAGLASGDRKGDDVPTPGKVCFPFCLALFWMELFGFRISRTSEF